MRAPALVIIADDLTGALDTAAPFAAVGCVTRVVPWDRARGAGETLRAAGRCDVAVVDTASRTTRPAVAAARVGAATRVARLIGAATLYKKIDSAWRGPLVAELQAFRRAAGVERLPLVPAFPAQGRTVQGGEPFADGAPLVRSAAAAGLPGGIAPDVVDRLRQASQDLELFDATTDADLRRIARTLAREGRLGATAGSAGFAQVLATMARRTRPAVRASHAVVVRRAGAVLIVAGSAHPSTRAQLRHAARHGIRGIVVPTEGARSSRAWREARAATVALARAWLSEESVIFLTLPDVAAGPVADRQAVAASARLAAVAHEVMAHGAPQALVVVGGDTLTALVRAHGITVFDSMGAIGPGVALASWRRAGRRVSPRWIVTKSGGFGRADTIVRLCRQLGL